MGNNNDDDSYDDAYLLCGVVKMKGVNAGAVPAQRRCSVDAVTILSQ